jgi:hypothetical protein
MPYFKPEHLVDLQEKLGTVEAKYSRLLLAISHHHRFKEESAWEYANHGFMRRVGTLRRCIENVFGLIPPETAEIPNRQVLYDAAINVQAFFANVYGSLDNLAWVWVYKRGLEGTIQRNRVGLRLQNIELRSTLSEAFQNYLKSRDEWMVHVIEYRDALAHRIPLYIPPGGVLTRHVDEYNDLARQMHEALYVRWDPSEWERLSAEQEKLLVFQPMITHSITETTARFPFHAQMIADFLTVEEFGYKMLDELKRGAI